MTSACALLLALWTADAVAYQPCLQSSPWRVRPVSGTSRRLCMLDETPSPSFECGGKNLVPQALPSFLLQYHERSLLFTEAALGDDTLRCERDVQYGPNPHQTLDAWSPSASVGGSSKALPIVVCLHGGGWEFVYKE